MLLVAWAAVVSRSACMAIIIHKTGFERVSHYIVWFAQMCTTAAETEKVDGRAVRRSLNATGRYVRQPTKDEKSQALMEEHGRPPGPGYDSRCCPNRTNRSAGSSSNGSSNRLATSHGPCVGQESLSRTQWTVSGDSFAAEGVCVVHFSTAWSAYGAFYDMQVLGTPSVAWWLR